MLVIPVQSAGADPNQSASFWQSRLGQSLYNGTFYDQGDVNGDGVPDGNKDFAAEGWCMDDLLLTFGFDMSANLEDPYPGEGFPGPGNLDNGSHSDLPDTDDHPDHFLVWDGDENGVYVPGNDDIALTFEELLTWVNGGDRRGQRDYVRTLQRDVAATYLNTLNNNCLAGNHDAPIFDSEIVDSYADAIEFIMNVGGDKKQQKTAWSDYGFSAHTELAAYNESGEATVV
jgi:hypothetical protein